MLPSAQSTDLLGLGFLTAALIVASAASRAKHLVEETGENLAGGALLLAILGLIFVLAE
jgi:hypothetical protein